jgi:hypothetical protein
MRTSPAGYPAVPGSSAKTIPIVTMEHTPGKLGGAAAMKALGKRSESLAVGFGPGNIVRTLRGSNPFDLRRSSAGE